MRVPVAVALDSRDGTVTKDAKALNALIELKGEKIPPDFRKRPGNSDLGLVSAGTAQHLTYFNANGITVNADVVKRETFGPLAVTSVGTFGIRALNAGAITRAGAVATVVTPTTHLLVSGDSVVIAGAVEVDYNGTFVVTVTGASTFTYAVANAPATPATGTITFHPVRNSAFITSADNGLTAGTTGYLLIKSNYDAFRLRSDWDFSATSVVSTMLQAATVPGVVFVDGFFCVMNPAGEIFSSPLNADPAVSVWVSTAKVIANKESGAGVALTRSQNYVVALKEFSTEPFYDAALPPPGSPLAPVDNGFSLVGCASGTSLAQLDGNLVWLSQTRQKGRSVHMMRGLEQQKVSTPAVERILNADDLATVHALGVKLDGHALYLLTLVTSNITLAYDLTAQTWTQWSSLTLGSSKAATITRDGTTATVTATAHGLADGDPVKISGCTQTEYNGIFQISYVSANVFTIEVTGTPATPATGSPLAFPYTETYFKFTKYVNAGGRDILMHESDGHLYQIASSLYQDAGIPINVFGRTPKIDGGEEGLKKLARVRAIADTVSDTAMVRWSDNDSSTFVPYRRVDLSLDQPVLRRCGAFRRRSVEVRHIGNNPLRIEALELEISK